MDSDDDSQQLLHFIDDTNTLHQDITHDKYLYTKVEDRDLNGHHRYVLLKIRQHPRAHCLHLLRSNHPGEWKSVCIYYVEADIWNFEQEEAMVEAITVIGEYKQQMALFDE